ncbi:AtpZ/AtpI family protein [Tenacibaculum sp. SG-28]|uniref:AtpZ/AtpI family protein n=1 Tax=Tenacibaculum sp. SG-28 TaxID=754426 RepID=UPI000CF377A8|nr:AtpZ/AtpI family protein [Tenacibaculum sp. SG-28]PQJ21779.1 hypothetical protein BSU00_06865 [Tenacibaculum sp. SG-28]
MKNKEPKKQLNKFIRFSGIALQMGLTIYLGSLLGEWLDTKYDNQNQLYTKICTLVAVFAAMFSVIYNVTNMSKKK